MFLWEVSIVLREIILNSEKPFSKRLQNPTDFFEIMNGVKRYDDVITAATITPDNIMKTIHLIAQLQFPWQKTSDASHLMRYIKILGEKEVDSVIHNQFGLSTKQLIFISLAAAGHLLNNPGFNTEQSYLEFGINKDLTKQFFAKLTIDFDDLRMKYKQLQSYDARWMYTWNPLELTPFISLSKTHPNYIYCPMPELLMRRVTSGIFFDIVGSKGFGEAYGPSFELYVGDVLTKIFTHSHQNVIKPIPMMDGKNIKHGVDWVVEDEAGVMIIECKAKRLQRDSKSNPEGESIKKDLGFLAEAILQTYKNLHFMLTQPEFVNNKMKACYPIIITLENWYLLSAPIKIELDDMVKKLVVESGLNASLLTSNPYSIMCSEEIEQVGQVIAATGIQPFFAKKTSSPFKDWDINGFSLQEYPLEMNNRTRDFFRDDWEKLKEEIVNKRVIEK